jgi:hypothetical protein
MSRICAASRVAAAVVDLLEVVGVEHQHAERLAEPARALHLGDQFLVHRAAVQQPGERVVA